MQSNPTGAGPSSFGNLHSNPEGVCSQRRAVTTATKGPWRDASGGVAFRLGWQANLRARLKPQESHLLLRESDFVTARRPSE